MITFNVSPDVKPYKSLMSKRQNVKEVFDSLLSRSTEATSKNEKVINTEYNSFAGAMHYAYSYHYPLVISPDTLWLAISQGFSHHINQNSKKLHKQFVKFEGKENIEIHRDFFIKGSPDNDWASCFPEFSDKISEHIGKKRDLIVSNFSTTGPLEKISSEIVLMDSVKSYFDYTCYTCCGIPRITLEGDTEDWENIKVRVQNLSEFDLRKWTDKLLPITDQFIAASKGNVDKVFWESTYKLYGGSGKDTASGWVNVLFPYRRNLRSKQEEIIESIDSKTLTHDELPSSLAQVPFKWVYHDQEFDMEFVGGLVGIEQNEDDLAVKPVFGWAVNERT